MPHRILLLTTSTGQAGDDGPEIGFDWMSVAVPYWRIREAGAKVAFASVRGGKPPGDPSTATLGETESGERAGAVNMFLGDETAVLGLAQSMPVAEVDAAHWDALLVADGRGALWDMHQTGAVGDLVSRVWASGAVVATLGTGASALLAAEAETGRTLVAGLRLTCLPDYGLDGIMPPYELEEALRQRGGQVFASGPGEPPAVIEEGRLITGQDARAAADVTLQMLDALDVYRPAGNGSVEIGGPAGTA